MLRNWFLLVLQWKHINNIVDKDTYYTVFPGPSRRTVCHKNQPFVWSRSGVMENFVSQWWPFWILAITFFPKGEIVCLHISWSHSKVLTGKTTMTLYIGHLDVLKRISFKVAVTKFQFMLCWVAFFCPASYLHGSLHTKTVVTVVPRWSNISLG